MSQAMDPKQRQQLLKEQAAQQQAQADRNLADAGIQQAMAEGEYAAPGYWDTISKLDFEYDDLEDDHFEDFISIEGSKFNTLGNLPYGDWQKFCWRIEQELWTRRNELQNNDSLDAVDMATMYGEQRPTHTDERESRLRAAERALKLQLSLSVGARGLRSGTEIHAVARSEQPDHDTEPDGRLARAKNWLTG